MNRVLVWLGTNEGRIISVLALAAELGGALWDVHLHQPVDIGPGGLGGGLAAILTASAALLAAPPAANAVAAHLKLRLMEKNDAQ